MTAGAQADEVAAVIDRRYKRSMAEILRRLEQVYERHPIYFLTACTRDRRKMLASDAVHGAFLSFARQAADRGVWVGKYVLMPDHMHWFVAVDDEQIRLSTWVKSLKNALSKALRSAGVLGPHWQKGFFDHVLRGAESYSVKWDYVRENPARARLVDDAGAWPFAWQINDLEYRRDLIL